MKDQFYFTINSNHSKKYFLGNSPSRFQVCLEQSINFHDDYECALIDFSCTTKDFDSPAKDVYVYFNVYMY